MTDATIEIEWADEVEWPEEPKPKTGFRLRDYQITAKTKVEEGWKSFSRQLLDMATGTGKTAISAAIALEEWGRGGRTLVLENRDALVRQTARELALKTGLQCDIEMAGDHASPFAPIVVASVPTLCRDARLTGFSENHFHLVIGDEAHHSMAKSWAKCFNYFHYGAASLAPDWEAPMDATYTHFARILGVTATPELTGKQSLGEFYQSVAFSYQLLEAVRDGWLVQPIAIMEPLAVDFKGLRTKRTPNGSDYDQTEIAKRMVPVIDALADQFIRHASNRKSMAFMPSVATAEMLSHAINDKGLRSVFVSGECLDRDEKTETFVQHGPGIVLCTSAMFVEGFDVPDVDCVFTGITKSKSYYRQKIGRATRPLRDILNGLNTPDERRAAIARSAKKDFLIIDPFCRCDTIDLCDAYDLFTDKPEVKAKMKASGEAPTEESAEKAERDFLKALEKEAKKHARKAARTIDPLAWAVSIGDAALANYVPETTWDGNPPTQGQVDFLRKQGIDCANIRYKGLASKIIGRVISRISLGLCTPHQLEFMHKLGIDEQKCATMTISEASALIDATKAAKQRHSPSSSVSLAPEAASAAPTSVPENSLRTY